MTKVTTSVCRLCDKEASLVKSHIIPRAFYEEFAKREMHLISNKKKYTRRIQKAIYGNFLCKSCENFFNQYDEDATKLIKQGQGKKLLGEVDNGKIWYISDALAHKDLLHQFALSVLWRATNSNIEAYNKVKLGSYEAKIKDALLKNSFSEELLGKTGLMLIEHRGSENKSIDVIFSPYQKNNGKNWVDDIGNFTIHIFGFPYGEIYGK